jgi:uncharacterized protein YkwD
VARKSRYLIGLLGVVLLVACTSEQAKQIVPHQPITSDVLNLQQANPTPTPILAIPAQAAALVSPLRPVPPGPPVPPQPPPPATVPDGGTGAAPYGAPPAVTAEELDLTQRLFGLINQDRAVRGLYPFVWNDILAGGARLHAWNMYHCGFSHYCPDGRSPCERMTDEGMTYTDCGENISYAGPYPTPWAGVYKIQESMINEPPTGWHHIHLTSTTLHRVGVGVYVDPTGYIWFVEDMTS